MDIRCVHYFISQESYWAQGVPIEIVEKSFCIGVFYNEDKTDSKSLSPREIYGNKS